MPFTENDKPNLTIVKVSCETYEVIWGERKQHQACSRKKTRLSIYKFVDIVYCQSYAVSRWKNKHHVYRIHIFGQQLLYDKIGELFVWHVKLKLFHPFSELTEYYHNL